MSVLHLGLTSAGLEVSSSDITVPDEEDKKDSGVNDERDEAF
jgi:hypothetical protein